MNSDDFWEKLIREHGEDVGGEVTHGRVNILRRRIAAAVGPVVEVQALGVETIQVGAHSIPPPAPAG